MSELDTAARGRELLALRSAQAAAHVARVPALLDALLTRPARLPRCLVTTGIGTSEGHARHLAELAPRALGQPARFASTGSLGAGPPPGAEADWLVVFSQGLSANARFALQHVEAWGGVVLVTGLAPTHSVEQGVSPDKRAWLLDLERRGVVRIELGCGAEYGALIRTIGARVGHAVAWSILRTLAARRLEDATALDVPSPALEQAQHAAAEVARGVIPERERVADFFAPERTLLLMGEAGALELCDHLPLKIAEGMLRPAPRAIDVLHFAHGPLQSLARRPLSILYLAPAPGFPLAAEPAPVAPGSPWPARLAAVLDPALHDLRVIGTALALPFAAIELEAIFDALILRHAAETGIDLVAWPGREREAALYAAGPERPVARATPARAVVPRPIAPPAAWLEQAVWPEVEGLLAAGRRTAILALGSIEQHGPHLPLATDRWIADALAAGLAERVGDALALPSIPFGCASEHLDFPGTLHVSPETLEAILADLLASIARHGFERAFVFTAHGGNVEALRGMRSRRIAAARPLEVFIEEGLDTGGLQSAVVAAGGLAPESAGPHAGEYESSVVAWLRPGSVRIGALAPGPVLPAPSGSPDSSVPPARGAQSLFYPSLRPNAPMGVLGDPTRARRERGSAYLGAWLDALERAYRAAFAVPGSAAPGPATGGAEKKRK